MGTIKQLPMGCLAMIIIMTPIMIYFYIQAQRNILDNDAAIPYYQQFVIKNYERLTKTVQFFEDYEHVDGIYKLKDGPYFLHPETLIDLSDSLKTIESEFLWWYRFRNTDISGVRRSKDDKNRIRFGMQRRNRDYNYYVLVYAAASPKAYYEEHGFLYMENGTPPKRGKLLYKLQGHWYLEVGKWRE